MTLAELGPDLLEHILDFVPDSLRSWAVLPRVNKLFKAAESRWHFKVVARDKQASVSTFDEDLPFGGRNLKKFRANVRHSAIELGSR